MHRRLTRVLVPIVALVLIAELAWADTISEFVAQERVFKRQLDAGDYANAEQTMLKMTEYAERFLAGDARFRAAAYIDAAMLYNAMERHRDAIQVGTKALKLLEPVVGPNDYILALVLTNLGSAHFFLDHDQEAEKLYRRVLKIHSVDPGRRSEEYAMALENVAVVLEFSGRHHESHPMFIEVLQIRAALHGGGDARVGQTLNNLGYSFLAQHRYEDARIHLTESMQICANALGPGHPQLIPMLRNLSRLELVLKQYDAAEKHVEQMERIAAERLGPGNRYSLGASPERGELYLATGRAASAEGIYRKLLELTLARKGSLQAQAQVQGDLGRCLLQLRKLDEARAAMDEAIRCGLEAQAYNSQMMRWYTDRSACRELAGQRAEALADVDQAIQYAERERLNFAGGESEQSEAFQGFGEAYRAGARLALADRDFAKAVEYSERARTRALFDQIATAHVDLLAGLPAAQAAELQTDVARAERMVAKAKRQFDDVLERVDPDTEAGANELAPLSRALGVARQRLFGARAALTNASPIYRRALAREFERATLDDIQNWSRTTKSLILYYLVDASSAAVLWIDPAAAQPEIVDLMTSATDAAILGIDEGLLNADKLARVMSTDKKEGVIDRLKNAKESEKAHDQLAALARILIPAPVQARLRSGELERLAIIPQGSLTFLPFEALILDRPGTDIQYLLDVSVPTLYVPSLTALKHLNEWKPPERAPARHPVLTLGDVNYLSVGQPVTDVRKYGPSTPSAEFLRVSSRPTPLPFTEKETQAVAAAFTKRMMGVGQLTKGLATEANVRHNAPGRRILHFACHGSSSAVMGNAFGALALGLGPSAATNVADDGYLTVAEIYPMDLQHCELAILSCCDTNVGPLQLGEGAWTISRSFLVAGAKRVVCSQWPVNDQATSVLMSLFAESIAESMSSDTLDAAKSLHESKQHLRRATPATGNPTFWAPFVLVGPP